MNSVYEKLFPKPYPVRSTVQVVLPFDALVAIEATVYLKRE
jgi:enamine deaminase RidA (YjgF/YER057c/UK114 family)